MVDKMGLEGLPVGRRSIDCVAFVLKEPQMYRTWRAVAAKKFPGGVIAKEEEAWSTVM
jgi:hypothetical protein